MDAYTIVTGFVVGVLGSLPPALLFELALRKDRRANVAAGLASIMASFAMMSVAIAVVRLLARERVLVFGVAEVVSFLLVWSIEAWRAWKDAQQGVGPRERKRGESTR